MKGLRRPRLENGGKKLAYHQKAVFRLAGRLRFSLSSFSSAERKQGGYERDRVLYRAGQTRRGRILRELPLFRAEAMVAAAILLLCLWIVLFIRAAFRAKRKSAALLQRVLGLLCAALTIYTLFCCLWGANYYADGFQDRSGLHAQPSSVEQLYRTTLYFAAQTAVYSGEVPRDETGCFSEGIDTLFRQSADLYPAVEREYPFLTSRALPPKPVFFSRLMSRFSFTGFYFPFTGRPISTLDAPRSNMPATIAHELAHQRGIAAEARRISRRSLPASKAIFQTTLIPATFWATFT
jgi:hypothetical protein